MRLNAKELAVFGKTTDHVDKRGPLLKKGHFNPEYKPRFFELKGNLLYYYKTSSDADNMEIEPTGVIILAGCHVDSQPQFVLDQKTFYPFRLRFLFDGVQTRSYELAAESEEARERWVSTVVYANYDFLRNVLEDLRDRVRQAEEKVRKPPALPAPYKPPNADAPASTTRDMAEGHDQRQQQQQPPTRKKLGVSVIHEDEDEYDMSADDGRGCRHNSVHVAQSEGSSHSKHLVGELQNPLFRTEHSGEQRESWERERADDKGEADAVHSSDVDDGRGSMSSMESMGSMGMNNLSSAKKTVEAGQSASLAYDGFVLLDNEGNEIVA